MYIKELSLHHFRNFDQVDQITFSNSSLLVAAAPNATGKTNFLESIVVLLRGKSFRGQLEDCIQWGHEEFTVRGVLAGPAADRRVAVQYRKTARRLRIEEEGEPVSPITFYAAYPFVLFLPEDTALFHRGPGMRRNFLNQVLVSSPAYLSALVQYQRVLRQRNAALKTARTPDDVATWTALLAEHAKPIWNARRMVVEFLNTHINDLYESLSGEPAGFAVQFEAGADGQDDLAAALTSAWQYEHRYAYTMYGPHRDDVVVTREKRPVQSTLSRGQMRGLVVAMKVAAWRFLKQTSKQEPVVLLDEILSELDEKRQAALLTHLPATQTLLTCTTFPAALRHKSDVHLLDLRKILTAAEKAEEQQVAQTEVEAAKEVQEAVPA